MVRKMKKIRNLLWGLVLIGIGIIWGLNAFDMIHINLFFRGWWTLFIIVPCFIGLFKEDGKVGNIIGILIGVGLLLGVRGVINLSIAVKLIVPIIFVLIGISVIFKDFGVKKVTKKIKDFTEEDLAETCATFSEQKVILRDNEFQNAKLDAIFGGVHFDIQACNIKENGYIKASAIFGGITIIAPSNVNVKVKSTSIFGGSENKLQDKYDPNNPTILVDALCLFGGVTVK